MKTLRPLSAELAEIARRELNENPKKINSNIEALRTWLSKQPHINAQLDDQFIVAFLRGCKYSLERSKEKIDLYYTVRSAIPEFFQGRDISTPKLQAILNLGLTIPLPTVDDKTDARILLIKQGIYDPKEVSIIDVIKVSCMISDLLLREDDASVICGQLVVIDLKGLSFGHIGQCTPALIKKMTTSIQDVFPIRQKGIHFVNTSSIFETVFKIFYNFLTPKLKKRIFVHSSIETLYKHINKELLPTEYGGNAGTTQSLIDDLKNQLMQRREWFIEDEQYKTDESKRLGTPKTAETMFGTVGSFRTLDID